MAYILGIVTALQIISAQVCWKLALTDRGGITFKELVSSELFKIALTPLFILGCVLYLTATLTFMYTLSRHSYSSTQAIVVSSSLLFTMLASAIIFNESLRLQSFIGFGLLLLGVLFITTSR